MKQCQCAIKILQIIANVTHNKSFRKIENPMSIDSNASPKPVNAAAITPNNLQPVYGIPVVPIIASATLSCVPPPPTPRNFRIPMNASMPPGSLPNNVNANSTNTEHASDDGNLNPDVPEFVPDFLGEHCPIIQ